MESQQTPFSASIPKRIVLIAMLQAMLPVQQALRKKAHPARAEQFA